MKKKHHILMIDPQNGFSKEVGDPNDLEAAFVTQQKEMNGELCVPDGMAALDTAAAAIEENLHAVDDWTITYDCHQELHIAHPMWYTFASQPPEKYISIDGVDRMLYFRMEIRGVMKCVPGPFTTIMEKKGGLVIGFLDKTGQFVEVCPITTMHTGFLRWTVDYNAKLKAGKRYPHMIWPPHCRIGTPSNNLVDSIRRARRSWEHGEFGVTTPITKGSNIKVESFGAVHAEIIDPDDETTQPNTHFVGLVSDEDQEIGICGLARGHCLASTAMDLSKQFPDPKSFMKRLVLLTDCTADVPGLEFLGDTFVTEASLLGMRSSTIREWLRS